MTLQDLERAVRPQFVWEPGEDCWKNPRDYNMSETHGNRLGLTIFIGLALLHKQSIEEISFYVKIPEWRVRYIYRNFNKHICAGLITDQSSLYRTRRKYSEVMVLKTKMVQNYLAYNYKCKSFKLTDLHCNN